MSDRTETPVVEPNEPYPVGATLQIVPDWQECWAKTRPQKLTLSRYERDEDGKTWLHCCAFGTHGESWSQSWPFYANMLEPYVEPVKPFETERECEWLDGTTELRPLQTAVPSREEMALRICCAAVQCENQLQDVIDDGGYVEFAVKEADKLIAALKATEVSK